MTRVVPAILVACVDDPVALSPPLVTETLGWAAASVEADPLADHRPVDDQCPAGSWGPEGAALEVDTGVCRYAWLEQTLPRAVVAGATLTADLWHTGLDAPEPAEAHVAILLGDRVMWETWAAIPSSATAWTISFGIDEPLAAGERIGLHLHNHGDNAWKLGPVTID